MDSLPSGTVTLLFSDIEGSTNLLKRLGSAYADALDGQRQVLRQAWTTHRGIELGTEGDSFYVVFPTASDAVTAAAEGQRGLAAYPWPAGERVRVRMGIHTGSPVVHDGAYVGMDVHRAARIASTAHGGQVVLSAAAAELVADSVPAGVGLRDLGTHELKDIERPERLHQLVLDGLDADFPPLKSLGATTRLPAPLGALVGRDGEMAELMQLLQGADVRLLTLTGPGGSGKTRLAIELARALVASFPDGVYFVPLATVTTAPAMWAMIAEVLDAPPDVRTSAALIDYVHHSRALFVLDNLEQLPDATAVVAELLAEAPRLTLIATSRRPVHSQGEYEHAVPALELPDDVDLGSTARSGAVQLFVQQAQRVRAGFRLSDDNAEDIAGICRQLDGLPLAVELVASRSKLLSPKALLKRLDMVLDIRSIDGSRPGRQQTLREAIAWSFELLTPAQQLLFRRLGVFSGGADLDAIEAIAAPDDPDILDHVSDLADASLITVSESSDFEPRIGMLETIRTFAREQFQTGDELDAIQRRHAMHYLRIAEENVALFGSNSYVDARNRLDVEHDNLQSALSWALTAEKTGPGNPSQVGLDLCVPLARYWWNKGHYSEGRRRVELAIQRAPDGDQPQLAQCMAILANFAALDDAARAQTLATASIDMWRRLGDHGPGFLYALRSMAEIEQRLGQMAAARALYEEALAAAKQLRDNQELQTVLGAFGNFEGADGHLERAFELEAEALAVALEGGNTVAIARYRQNHACNLRMLGRVAEAHEQVRSIIVQSLALEETSGLVSLAEDYAAILAELGDHRRAVRMFGAADASSEEYGWGRLVSQDAELAAPKAVTRAALPAETWEEAYEEGRRMTVEAAISEAYTKGLEQVSDQAAPSERSAKGQPVD